MTGGSPTRFRILAVTAALLAAGLDAEESAPANERKPRTVSPKMSEALRERGPKFDPDARTAATKRAADRGTINEDGLLELPKFTVKENAFPAQEVRLTDDARLARAMRNHPGLQLGNRGQQGDVAELLSREEVLALHQRETSDLINHVTLDHDTPEARQIRKLLGSSVQQPSYYWSYDRGKGKP